MTDILSSLNIFFFSTKNVSKLKIYSRLYAEQWPPFAQSVQKFAVYLIEMFAVYSCINNGADFNLLLHILPYTYRNPIKESGHFYETGSNF